jgi:hypothetical protein
MELIIGAMLAALKQYPEQFRGVAVISSNPNETTDKEIRKPSSSWCAWHSLQYC